MMSRMPIYLDKNSVALITVYSRPDHLEDIWITDYPEYDIDYDQAARDAAKQFIDQLEGRWTPRFLSALKDEINKRLGDNDGIIPNAARNMDQ